MRFIPFLMTQIKHGALFYFSSRKRPSAFESLSHEWFQVRGNVAPNTCHNHICVRCIIRTQTWCNCVQDEQAGEDTDEISTRNLKAFISKRKWQVRYSRGIVLHSDLTVFSSSTTSPALVDLHRVSSHPEAHPRAAGCSSQGNRRYRSPRASGTQQQLSEQRLLLRVRRSRLLGLFSTLQPD